VISINVVIDDVLLLNIQLAQPGDTSGEDLPPCELPSNLEGKDRGAIMPVPMGIRPTLSRHRIEVRRPPSTTVFIVFSIVHQDCSCRFCSAPLSTHVNRFQESEIKLKLNWTKN